MKIVTVIPLQKGVFKEDLTYFTLKDIAEGSIVKIPVRNKTILGLAVSSENLINEKSSIKDLPFNLKKITEITGQPVFRKEFLESIMEAGKYFASRKNNAITALIPSAYREGYDKIAKIETPSPSEIRPKSDFSPFAGGDKKIKSEKLVFQAPMEDRMPFYKTLIRSSFADKKSIFIVLPNERDIQIFKSTLGAGIQNFTFAVHGNLSPKKQIEQFKNIVKMDHPVLIFGTAQFLSIPRKDIGTIILEQESRGAYKTMSRPYLDLRAFVELYASKTGAKLILSDSLLRYETIARKEMGGLAEMHPLSFRINFGGEIKISAPAPREAGEKFKVLADDSVREIKNAVSSKKNVFIFALRKGLATQTVCRDCNEAVMCDKCSAPVVLYLSQDGKKRMFVCNRCNREKSPDTKCALCQSWNLMPLGIGTDTVFEETKKLFPKTKIFKLDKESAKTAKGADKIAREFENNLGSILVGTEMALFYLKEKVPLSVVASFDSLWSIPNFRMGEKIIQFLLAIISKTGKKLIIQTKNENDPAIIAIKTENLLSFIREELEDRQKLGYPPFKHFIKITHLGNREESTEAKNILSETLKEYRPEIFSGFVAKLKGKYITNALLKMDPEKWSLPELSTGSSIDENLLAKLLSLPPSFSVNVDPEDLL